jgi:hypothetical protein
MPTAHQAFGGGAAKAHDERAFQQANAPGRGGGAGDFVQLESGGWVPAGMAGALGTTGADPLPMGDSLAPLMQMGGGSGDPSEGFGMDLTTPLEIPGQRSVPASSMSLAALVKQAGRAY